ncbi:uncharacterized protein LOC125648896 isoform X2 [Ostrea edulis]|nr:uncharacterized protein LOC125648896 isoform X2 [Ostrea edulis]
MGNPMEMRGGMGAQFGGGMDFMVGGSRGMNVPFGGRGNGIDIQSLISGGRSGGHSFLPGILPNTQGGQIVIPGQNVSATPNAVGRGGISGIGRTGDGTSRQIATMGRGSGAGRGNMSSMANFGGLQGGLPGMVGMPGVGMGGMQGMSGMQMGGVSGMQGRGTNDEFINQILEEERGRADACDDSIGQGFNTFILFDNSITMYGPTTDQAKDFVENFLQGLEDNSMDYGVEENVALITCGGTAPKVDQHLTNEYQCLRTKLESIQTHGTIKLIPSLMLVLGAMERAFEMKIGHHSIMPRIILVSNGNFVNNNSMAVVPTMAGVPAGGGGLQELTQTIEVLQNILKNHHMKLFFIPVGDASQEFKSLMQNLPGAKVIEASDLKGVTRTHIHHLITGTVKEQTHGNHSITEDVVKEVASTKYPNTEERDIDEVMKLLREDQEHDAQRQERYLQQNQRGVPNTARMVGPGMMGGGGGITPQMSRGIPRGVVRNVAPFGEIGSQNQLGVPNMGRMVGPRMIGGGGGITPNMVRGIPRGMVRNAAPFGVIGSQGMQPPRMNNNTNLQSLAGLGISPGRGPLPGSNS